MMPQQYQPALNDEIFDLPEAAKFIRLSETSLERSDCPRARVGRRVLFLRSQLLAYVAVRLSHVIEMQPSSVDPSRIGR